MPPPRFVSTGTAARHLGVSRFTVARWIREGRVAAVRTLGGHHRIPLAELERHLQRLQGHRARVQA